MVKWFFVSFGFLMGLFYGLDAGFSIAISFFIGVIGAAILILFDLAIDHDMRKHTYPKQ